MRSKAARGPEVRTAGSGIGVLSRYERRFLEAISARILPTTDTPGAVEAGAVYYVDQALAGAYRPLLSRYRRGLRQIDEHANKTAGHPFVELDGDAQDAILIDVEDGQLPCGADFFRLMRRHILEGVFGEPHYGGNRDLVGWGLVGFPGQQYGYADPYINRPVDLPPVAVDRSSDQ